MAQRILVIGNGMVGHHFVEQLIGSDAGQAGRFDIQVFGAEPTRAYDRVHLSEVFERQSSEHLLMGPASLYQGDSVSLTLAAEVGAIDRAGKRINVNGDWVDYDALVLATGSFPFVPPIPGGDVPGTFVYRTLEDLDAIQARAKTSKTGVVAGGGWLGLEAANALKALGVQVHTGKATQQVEPVGHDAAQNQWHSTVQLWPDRSAGGALSYNGGPGCGHLQKTVA
ncbi:hypothetical protein GH975_09560 [Litorivicinus lipolyticus]|uniref:FAD/NAD(P)-binding domain-containing protein n=1 Tax=Litorivicinus lipolyticus TaxID=418701 RepID=A0A5Q2QEL5_9GAMM|nr:FAD-dependent oxidoreductase [Litorivicinus lipolyticus]QGG80801.1 hypothetical protein GH975_09560 [Litorivicinus lipolyticus]